MKIISRLVLLSLVLMMYFCPPAEAQVNTDDIVFLKNGSVIHGSILEIIPNQTIKIQTADHNIFVFKMEEVEKISKNYPESFAKKETKSVTFFSIAYFTGIGDASLDGLTEKNGYHALSFRIATGSRMNKEFSYGIGIGYERYSGDESYLPATEYIPVFLELRILFSPNGDPSPGLNFDLGYDIGLTRLDYANDAKFSGGIFLNPSFNITSKLNSNLALLFDMGYEFQSHSISYSSGGYGLYNRPNSTLESSFLTFSIGLEF